MPRAENFKKAKLNFKKAKLCRGVPPAVLDRLSSERIHAATTRTATAVTYDDLAFVEFAVDAVVEVLGKQDPRAKAVALGATALKERLDTTPVPVGSGTLSRHRRESVVHAAARLVPSGTWVTVTLDMDSDFQARVASLLCGPPLYEWTRNVDDLQRPEGVVLLELRPSGSETCEVESNSLECDGMGLKVHIELEATQGELAPLALVQGGKRVERATLQAGEVMTVALALHWSDRDVLRLCDAVKPMLVRLGPRWSSVDLNVPVPPSPQAAQD